jgi:acetylornithine/succinyldiaminopimelate/putrescine aminotransferase
MSTTFGSAKGNLMKGVKTLLPQFVAKTSKGIHVETECGKRFTDFTSGIGVTNLGKFRKIVVRAEIFSSSVLFCSVLPPPQLFCSFC